MKCNAKKILLAGWLFSFFGYVGTIVGQDSFVLESRDVYFAKQSSHGFSDRIDSEWNDDLLPSPSAFNASFNNKGSLDRFEEVEGELVLTGKSEQATSSSVGDLNAIEDKRGEKRKRVWLWWVPLLLLLFFFLVQWMLNGMVRQKFLSLTQNYQKVNLGFKNVEKNQKKYLNQLEVYKQSIKPVKELKGAYEILNNNYIDFKESHTESIHNARQTLNEGLQKVHREIENKNANLASKLEGRIEKVEKSASQCLDISQVKHCFSTLTKDLEQNQLSQLKKYGDRISDLENKPAPSYAFEKKINEFKSRIDPKPELDKIWKELDHVKSSMLVKKNELDQKVAELSNEIVPKNILSEFEQERYKLSKELDEQKNKNIQQHQLLEKKWNKRIEKLHFSSLENGERLKNEIFRTQGALKKTQEALNSKLSEVDLKPELEKIIKAFGSIDTKNFVKKDDIDHKITKLKSNVIPAEVLKHFEKHNLKFNKLLEEQKSQSQQQYHALEKVWDRKIEKLLVQLPNKESNGNLEGQIFKLQDALKKLQEDLDLKFDLMKPETGPEKSRKASDPIDIRGFVKQSESEQRLNGLKKNINPRNTLFSIEEEDFKLTKLLEDQKNRSEQQYQALEKIWDQKFEKLLVQLSSKESNGNTEVQISKLQDALKNLQEGLDSRLPEIDVGFELDKIRGEFGHIKRSELVERNEQDNGFYELEYSAAPSQTYQHFEQEALKLSELLEDQKTKVGEQYKTIQRSAIFEEDHLKGEMFKLQDALKKLWKGIDSRIFEIDNRFDG